MKVKDIIKSRSGRIFVIFLTCLSLVLSAGISEAKTFVVTNTLDGAVVVAGSLRRAVLDANASIEASNTIIFGVKGLITLTGEIQVSKELTIKGPGIHEVSISGGGLNPIFIVGSSATLDISGLTLRNANGTGYLGGGVINNGILKVSDAAFIDNTAPHGGAIYSDTASYPGGYVVITGTTFSGNSASVTGGGAIFLKKGDATISGSTFSANQGSNGGAVAVVDEGTLTILNSTFYNNSGSSQGGAISTFWTNALTLLNCTFSGNSAPSGGALYIYNFETIVNVVNTIFADSTGSSNCNRAITGTNSHNIDHGGPATLNTCGAGNTEDPVLSPLSDNGGQTETMAIWLTSAARNTGDPNNFPSTDQRGWQRPSESAPDIGAFELTGPYTLWVNRSGNGTVKSSPAGIFCTTGCDFDTNAFPVNRSVTLSAIPDTGLDIFSPGWSGDVGCESTVSMTTNMTCTATFTHCTDNPVSTGFVRYSTIMEPYNLLGPTLLLTATASHLMGDVDLDRSSVTQVTLKGGYNCGLTDRVDFTYIDGRILVKYGSLILDRIVIL